MADAPELEELLLLPLLLLLELEEPLPLLLELLELLLVEVSAGAASFDPHPTSRPVAASTQAMP